MRIKNQTVQTISANIFNASWVTVFNQCLDNEINPLLVFDTLSKVSNGYSIRSTLDNHMLEAVKGVQRVKK